MPREHEPLEAERLTQWRAVAEVHRAYFTGLVLHLVSRRGSDVAADFVFRVFRRQHHERFLPGLRKLGLTDLPDAVAAARYHYLSNWIGGVPVEYMPDSDRKAWVRYPPPRWVWGGTAMCGIPSEVSRAILRGWHAHNGVSLGNPRLGFVCTKQAVDGQDGLEGFYCEYDREISEDERLVFAPHLEAPPFDPAKAPTLPVAQWPPERLARAHRDYAMEYVRTSLPVMAATFGPDDAGEILQFVGRLVGMQYAREILAAFASSASDPQEFLTFLHAFLRAQGDEASIDPAGAIRQSRWRLVADLPDAPSTARRALLGLVEGMAAACFRGASVQCDDLRPAGEAHWRVSRKALQPAG